KRAPTFEILLNACRQSHRQAFGSDEDLVVGLQLTHSGRYSFRAPQVAFYDPLLDPRGAPCAAMHETVAGNYPIITDEALSRMVDCYVAAARLAHKIGFQFVDIKQCHRYLLNELLAARTRPGRYGGTLENRTRLASEIFSAIRSAEPELILA